MNTNSKIKIPSNHKFSERKLIKLVESSEFIIKSNGEIWRQKRRIGKTVFDIKPTRAERKGKDGYLTVRGMFNGVRHTGAAHRLVWQYFKGKIPNGLTINHKDGIKDNNHPDNLELATYSEQNKHCYYILKKRSQKGEKNNQAKIKDSDISKIISLYNSKKHTQLQIANIFSVSHQQISKIINGDRRNHNKNVIKKDHRNCDCLVRDNKGKFIGKK